MLPVFVIMIAVLALIMRVGSLKHTIAKIEYVAVRVFLIAVDAYRLCEGNSRRARVALLNGVAGTTGKNFVTPSTRGRNILKTKK